MRRRVSSFLILIVFIAGLSLLLYPLIANEWNSYRQSKLVSNYETVVAEREQSGEIDYDAEWERAEAYNEGLLPSILPDSFAVAEATEEIDEEYMGALNLAGDGMMGTIEIPKINVDIPIYHTTEDRVLQMAAGHLEGSSLPVGGSDTHAVISAHRGLPSATLFTDLDQLILGDHFLIHVLDETLCYEVDQVLVVEPEETDSLAVVPGEDLVTLLTCTPYGVNTQRLLVRGHRVPYEEAVLEESTNSLTGVSLHTNYVLWVVVGLAITGCFVFLLSVLDRRKRKKMEGEETREQS